MLHVLKVLGQRLDFSLVLLVNRKSDACDLWGRSATKQPGWFFYWPGRCAAGRRPAPSRSRPSSCCFLTGCPPAACSVSPSSSPPTSAYWCKDAPPWTPRLSGRCCSRAATKRETPLEQERRKGQVSTWKPLRVPLCRCCPPQIQSQLSL